MVVIWSGLGFLALLVPLTTVVAMQAIANAMGGPLYSKLHHWPGAVGGLVGAALLYLLSRRLNAPAGSPDSSLRRRHTMFWLPLQVWAAVAAVCAIVWMLWPVSTPAL